MHLNAYDAITLYSELEIYVDCCKAISHPIIGIRNMRKITPTCKIVAYIGNGDALGKGPFRYAGLWYAIQTVVLTFKLKLHENKHNSSV